MSGDAEYPGTSGGLPVVEPLPAVEEGDLKTRSIGKTHPDFEDEVKGAKELQNPLQRNPSRV